MIYQLSATDEAIWSFNCTGHLSFPFSFAFDVQGDVYVTDLLGNHFILIMRSTISQSMNQSVKQAYDSVVDYQFDDLSLFVPSIAICADSTIYLSDAYSRILILTSRPPLELSSNDHYIWVVIASGGSLVLLTVVSMVLLRSIYTKSLTNVKQRNCDSHHASRRDRFCRRGTQVNFLPNFHDNLRLPIDDEHGADYVLHI